MSSRTNRLQLDRDVDRLLVKHHPLATHVQWFPSGARIEFRPARGGHGWASLAYNQDGRSFGSWIHFGSERPKAAIEISRPGKTR